MKSESYMLSNIAIFVHILRKKKSTEHSGNEKQTPTNVIANINFIHVQRFKCLKIALPINWQI